MPNKYQLVVFDWDGTVMDSEARISICMQLAARDCGYPVPQRAEIREIIGLSMQKAIYQLSGVEDAQEIKRLGDAYRTHWLNDDIGASALFASAEETLQQLTEQGYLLAIATGKSRRGLDKALQETSLGRYFHMSRCADETHSKPHPQMVLDILTDLDTMADKALVIGDTEFDMQMAANAKVDAVGVSYGAHASNRLKEQGALAIFDTLLELPEWLAEQ
jgi:phosphoglycolate phosphatase